MIIPKPKIPSKTHLIDGKLIQESPPPKKKTIKKYTDPVAKTPHSQCMGPGFDPQSENYDPTCPQLKSQHMAAKIPHVTTKNPAQ